MNTVKFEENFFKHFFLPMLLNLLLRRQYTLFHLMTSHICYTSRAIKCSTVAEFTLKGNSLPNIAFVSNTKMLGRRD